MRPSCCKEEYDIFKHAFRKYLEKEVAPHVDDLEKAKEAPRET